MKFGLKAEEATSRVGGRIYGQFGLKGKPARMEFKEQRQGKRCHFDGSSTSLPGNIF